MRFHPPGIDILRMRVDDMLYNVTETTVTTSRSVIQKDWLRPGGLEGEL